MDIFSQYLTALHLFYSDQKATVDPLPKEEDVIIDEAA
jgi:hypothetical protein